ncbi:MAG: hypothetical protein WBM17_14330 [Anaerolineales bacterium]
MAVEFHVRHLLMEMEQVETAQQIMGANTRMMIADMASVQTILEELRATWQGYSAMEFFSMYDSNSSAVNAYITRLDEMFEKFHNEILAWEEMAKYLAGSG